MKTAIKTEQDVTLAAINGDLDHHTAKYIRGEIDREITAKRPKRLVIDFSGVTFMDSSGIGLIMGRYKLMQDFDGEVVVARPPAYIKKVLRLAGMDKITKITDDIGSVVPKCAANTSDKPCDKEEANDEKISTKAN